MEQREIASLEVETRPLPGQVFYILDKNASEVTPPIGAGYAKIINLLRSEAVKIFITDRQGKAKIEGLKAGTYYVCGVGEQEAEFGMSG